MKNSFRTSCFLLLAGFSVSVHAQALDTDSVLEKMIHAYGGQESLRKLDSMVQEWDFVALMGNRHGSDVRSVRVPNQLRVELTYPDKKETRILNGDDSHVIFGGRPAPTPSPNWLKEHHDTWARHPVWHAMRKGPPRAASEAVLQA